MNEVINNEIKTNENKRRFSAYDMEQYILSTYRVINIEGNPYMYIKEGGYYKLLAGRDADCIIRSIVPRDQRVYINSNFISEVVSWLYSDIGKMINMYQRSYECSSRYINFIDCYYDLITQQVCEHNPDIIFTSYNNVALKKRKTTNNSTPYFDKVLHNICQGDKSIEMLLLEHYGYILSGIRNLKNFTVLYGPKDTGKSLWINLYKMTVGNNFVSSIALQQLSDRFMTCELAGKKLNVCGDLDTTRFDVGMLKRLTGNDIINADVKNQRPISFINNAALVFGSNTLEFISRSADPQNAVFQRLVILPFFNVIPKEDQIENIDIKLTEELPDIVFKYAIPGLHRLLNQGLLFTYCNKANEIKLSINALEQGMISFLTEWCEFGVNLRCYINTLYEYYCNYCSNYDFPIVTHTVFSRFLLNAHKTNPEIPILEKEKYRHDGEYRYGFVGIGIKNNVL